MMTDDRWNALTDEQRKFLSKLGRAPWKWFVSDDRYAATFRRMERENAAAKADAEVATNRHYWDTVSRCTSYTGPDYRVRMHGQDTWIRATELQYEQAEMLGMQRSIGLPDFAPLAITA